MKLDANSRGEIETSEDIAPTSFQIKTSAKAFQALLSNIYTNKIRAIVRELSCNAWDAHKEVGKENEPFYIHAPTRWEPKFIIRDYGPGLSDFMIRGQKRVVEDSDGIQHTVYDGGLYTTLFDSTKEETNDAIGAYGLGSKTPFSYTDSFTIKSYQNGEMNVYNAYMGSDGAPQIAWMGRTESDETGLEIQIPVKGQDYQVFQHEIQDILRDFAVIPNVDNATVEPTKYSQKTKDWGLRSDDQKYKAASRHHGFDVVMNGVRYNAVDVRRVVDIDPVMMRDQLDLFARIGDVNVDVSRENLSNDEKTQRFVRRGIRRFNDEVMKQYRTEAKKYENAWDACYAVREMIPHWSMRRAVFGQGIYTKSGEEVPLSFKFPRKIIKGSTFFKRVFKQTVTGRSHSSMVEYDGLNPGNTVIVLQDKHNTGGRVAKEYCRVHQDATVYVVRVANRSLSETRAQKVKRYLERAIGGAPVYLSSQLPGPKSPTKTQPNQILKFDVRWAANDRGEKHPTQYGQNHWNDITTMNTDFDFNKGGYYVRLNGFIPTRLENKDEPIPMLGDSWLHFCRKYMNAGSIPNLYGVRAKEIENFKAAPQWKSLEEVVEETVQSTEVRQQIEYQFMYDKTWEANRQLVRWLECMDSGVLEDIKALSVYGKECFAYKLIKWWTNTIRSQRCGDSVLHLFRRLGDDVNRFDKEEKDCYTQLHEHYPEIIFAFERGIDDLYLPKLVRMFEEAQLYRSQTHE